MTKIKLFLILIIFLAYSTTRSQAQTEIEKLSDLIDYLTKYPNSKVGFLTQSLYESVRKVLPKTISPLFVDNKNYLMNGVINGTLVAALTPTLPDKRFQDNLHMFSSNVITLYAILMSPDHSAEQVHGNRDEALVTYDLAKAINAAITQMQFDGVDVELAKRYGPRQLVQAYTCKSDNGSASFMLPNRADAKGLLRTIIDESRIKVLADGPYNWGNNEGNYLTDPPVGFYPDYLSKLVDILGKLAGPDGVPYGEMRIERVYSNSTHFPWYWLFDGTTHISEPYFLLDSAYDGSNRPCNTDDDCFLVESKNKTAELRENCTADKHCRYYERPRITMLRASCTTFGSDSIFSTKKFIYNNGGDENKKPDDNEISLLAYILIISLSVLSALLLIGLIVALVKRRRAPSSRSQRK